MSTSKERLDKLLVYRGLVDTRNRAAALILAGRVKANGELVSKAGTFVDIDCDIEIVRQDSWVSRGAHKLLKALDVFGVNPGGLVCIDIGASTGGFTHVLLERGAKKVYAVDVGYGQLAWSLRQDERVVVREKTNARYLRREDFDEDADLITVDVSFISLKLILPVLVDLLSKSGDIIALVKPQFEAGRERIGKGGVVADPKVHEEVLRDLILWIERNVAFNASGLTHSPIKGPKGNIEFLLHLTPRKIQQSPLNFNEAVLAAHDELN